MSPHSTDAPESKEPFELPPFAGEFMAKAITIVHTYVNAQFDKTDTPVRLTTDDCYVVWFCKTLQNWKCMISTTLPDGMYYELTYDGDRQVTYLDPYKKWDNIEIPDTKD
jgi:Family of unknown function (DUF6275)